METDPRIIICVPIDLEHVKGSVVRQCEKCGGDIWVAPTSMAELKEGDKLICLACIDLDLLIRDAEFGGFIPGQIEELERYYMHKRTNG